MGVLAMEQICLLPLAVSSLEPTRVWVRGNSDAQSQKEKLGCPVRLSQSTEYILVAAGPTLCQDNRVSVASTPGRSGEEATAGQPEFC